MPEALTRPDDLSIGFFGKLPSHGDFLSRRLPRSFVDPWDSWLQSRTARRGLAGDLSHQSDLALCRLTRSLRGQNLDRGADAQCRPGGTLLSSHPGSASECWKQSDAAAHRC